MDDKAKEIIEALGKLKVTTGAHAGENFEVLPWQSKFIKGAFRPSITQAACSVARGNGKSELASGLACCAFLPDFPLVQPYGETVCIGSSFTQAKIIFDSCIRFSKPWIDSDLNRWRIQDSVNTASIEDRRTGAKIKCIGSNPKSAHGFKQITLVICDEVAQWEKSTSDLMRAALSTAQGKASNSRLLAIGTKPAAHEASWFSKMLEGKTPGVFTQVFSADVEDDYFNKRTWRKANPSLDHMPDLLRQIKIEAKQARLDSSSLQTFKALRLNLGTDEIEQNYLLDPETWVAAEGKATANGRTVWGIDLGQNRSFSCVSCTWEGGKTEVIAGIGDNPSIEERSLADNCGPNFYKKMWERKELFVLPGRVIKISDFLNIALERFGQPSLGIICDDWRRSELLDALTASSVQACPVFDRRQGFKEQGQDIRDFKRGILSGNFKPVESLLMRSAINECRVIKDPAANEKISKSKRARGRDDAIVATILSVAFMQRLKDKEQAEGENQSVPFEIIPVEMSVD